jgi:hypothetical protein
VAVNDRILVKNQSNTMQNGIYYVTVVGTGSNGTWLRAIDADANDKVTSGLTTIIADGNVNVGKSFRLTTPDPIFLGNTGLTFVDPSASPAPAGANTQVQFNDAGITSATAGFTFNKFSNVLIVGNSISTSTLTTSGNVGIGTAAGNIKLTISSNPVLPSVGPPTDYTSLWGVGADGSAHNIAWDSFGGQMLFIARRANGTAASPTGLISGNPIFQFAARGYGATQYGTSGRAQFTFTAAENWTDTAQGAYITFSTAAIGTTSTLERVRIDDAGNVGIGNIAPLHKLSVSGDVFASGNITAPYFLGNGALLTGIVSGGGSYSNIQVAAYLPTYTGNVGKIYYDPNNGFVGFNDTSPDYVYDFYTPDNAGEILHIEGGVGTQAFFGARNSSGLNYAAGADQNYAFSGTRDTTNDYALITNNLVRANIQGSSGNVIFTQSITVANDVITRYLGVEEFRSTDANITVRSDMIFIGQELSGMAKLAVGTENPGAEAFTVLGGTSYFDRDVTIMGNLFVNGNTTTFTSNNITLKDSLIYLADENPADTVDIGFVGSFNNVIRYQHTGFVRDATDGTWKLFANVVPEPTTTIDFTNASYSNLQVGNLTLSGITPSTSTTTGALQVVGGVGIRGNLFVGGNIQDSKGDVRASPINSQPGSYTAVAADAGKTIVESLLGSTITFNANVFAAGDMISVINTSAGSITLVQGTSVTLRLAGTATTGNRTVATNGLATVICSVGGATPTFYCSGAGLT